NLNTAASAQHPAAARAAASTAFALGRPRLVYLALSSLPSHSGCLSIVRPETVVRWHRKGFTSYWRWKSRSPGGRPRIAKEVRDLIRRMSFENSMWGATKIHGELLKLGIAVAQSTVSVYMVPRRVGHCRHGRPSFAIIWRGLRRLICSWFPRLRFSSCSHVLFLATNVDSCCGLR